MHLLVLDWTARTFEIRGGVSVIHRGAVTECAAEVSMPNDIARDYDDGRMVTIETRGQVQSSLTLTIVRHPKAPADPSLEWLRAFASWREPNVEVQVVNASYPSGPHTITRVVCAARLAEDGHAWSFKFERLYVFRVSPLD